MTEADFSVFVLTCSANGLMREAFFDIAILYCI